MEWLGYLLGQLRGVVVGVSGSKAKWLEEWVTRVLKDMLVTGREFKVGSGPDGLSSRSCQASKALPLHWLILGPRRFQQVRLLPFHLAWLSL